MYIYDNQDIRGGEHFSPMFINAKLRLELMSSQNLLPVYVADMPYSQPNQMAGSVFNASGSFEPAALPVLNSPFHNFEPIKQEDCSQLSCSPTFASRSLVSSPHDEIRDFGHVEAAMPRYQFPEAEDGVFFGQLSKIHPEELENWSCFDLLMAPDHDENADEWALGNFDPLPVVHSETQLTESHQPQSGCKSPRSNEFVPVSTSPAESSPYLAHTASEHMMAYPFPGYFSPSSFGAVQDPPNDMPLELSSMHCTAYVDCWGDLTVDTGLAISTEPAWSLDYNSQPDQIGDNLLIDSLPSSPASPLATLYTKISSGTLHTVLPDEMPLLNHTSSAYESDANDIMVSAGDSSTCSSHDPITNSPPFGFRSCWGLSSAPGNYPLVHVPRILDCSTGKEGMEPSSRPRSPSHDGTMENGRRGEVPNLSIEHAASLKRPFARRALKLKLVRRPVSEQMPARWPGVKIEPSEMETSTSDTKHKAAITQPKERDLFLLRSRLAGMTYKEIRRLGGFTEAESTLRGRHRSLIKEKHERVRRPKWENKDAGSTSLYNSRRN